MKPYLIGAGVVAAMWFLVIWTESSQDLSTWQLVKERAEARPATFWLSLLAGAVALPQLV